MSYYLITTLYHENNDTMLYYNLDYPIPCHTPLDDPSDHAPKGDGAQRQDSGLLNLAVNPWSAERSFARPLRFKKPSK